MRSFSNVLLPAIVAGIACLVATPAQAQLSFFLTPNSLFVVPGQSLTFTGTIENQSASDTYFVNSLGFLIGETEITADTSTFDGYFGAAFPTFSLAPGEVYSGALLDALIGVNAPVRLTARPL